MCLSNVSFTLSSPRSTVTLALLVFTTILSAPVPPVMLVVATPPLISFAFSAKPRIVVTDLPLVALLASIKTPLVAE